MPHEQGNNRNNTITERQLTLGLWYLTHREQLRRALIGFLIATIAVTWSYALFGSIMYVVIGGAELDRSLETLVASGEERAVVVRRQRAQEIEIIEVHLVPAGSGTYDVAARIVNPNPKFRARVTYTMSVPGAADETQDAVLLPGAERWLTRLNVATSAPPGLPTFTIVAVDWHRISHREIADVAAFMSERFHVTVDRTQFIPSRDLAARVSRATITMTNASAYGLRDLELTVLLRRAGDVLVGVNRMTIPMLRAGETRTDAATWFQDFGAVQAIEVIPFVDVFDPDSFLGL